MKSFPNASTPDTARSSGNQTINPQEWVASHGDYLFRHAMARTGRQEVAEDVVQETFLAAWKSAHRYAGRASERTWLLSILRNKIADHYRSQRPEISTRDVEALAFLEEQQFTRNASGSGPWKSSGVPTAWSDARQSLEQAEFWETLHECAHKLPEKTARVFLLRELDGWESPAICRELKNKPSHLFVKLHRARLALRRCLEMHWFQNDSTSG
jgi:RNA polymerase sigma-70 factor (ECF subfamily)